MGQGWSGVGLEIASVGRAAVGCYFAGAFDCVCRTRPRYRIVGQIFTYTFIALFIYVVLNVFIAIIEESLFTVVQRGKEMVEEMRWA